MRVDPELTYQDYKDGVIGAFHLLGRKGHETADTITDWLADEDDDLLIPNSTSLAIWIISIGEYEVRHNILEDRVLEQLSYHIPRFQMGKYVDDLSEEEYEQVKADIDYILSKVELIKLENLEDDEE
jgi:hypothetical protein